jgi:hypothetical protein
MAAGGVSGEVRERVLELLRAGLSTGDSSLEDYETAIEAALHATTETELAELVRKYAPPVLITAPERRYDEPRIIETVGMFNDIRLRGRWQVARDLTVRTNGSRIVVDFSEAEFDDWTIDLTIVAGGGFDAATVIVPRGMCIQVVGKSQHAYAKLEPSVPGFPVIRLSASTVFGKLKVKHPRAKRSEGRARRR